MKWLLMLLGCTSALCAQELQVEIRPVYRGAPIVLEQPFGPDSTVLHTLRLYVGRLSPMQGSQVLSGGLPGYRLLDFETEPAPRLSLPIPAGARPDGLQLTLGVDSATTMAGAMSGDLDPTRGMFWTWQSGYVNIKIEGYSPKCTARNREFEFHLGGFRSPWACSRVVQLPLQATTNAANWRLDLDLYPFFEAINWSALGAGIMSPGKAAADLSAILAQSIQLYVR